MCQCSPEEGSKILFCAVSRPILHAVKTSVRFVDAARALLTASVLQRTAARTLTPSPKPGFLQFLVPSPDNSVLQRTAALTPPLSLNPGFFNSRPFL